MRSKLEWTYNGKPQTKVNGALYPAQGWRTQQPSDTGGLDPRQANGLTYLGELRRLRDEQFWTGWFAFLLGVVVGLFLMR